MVPVDMVDCRHRFPDFYHSGIRKSALFYLLGRYSLTRSSLSCRRYRYYGFDDRFDSVVVYNIVASGKQRSVFAPESLIIPSIPQLLYCLSGNGNDVSFPSFLAIRVNGGFGIPSIFHSQSFNCAGKTAFSFRNSTVAPGVTLPWMDV